MTDDAAKPGNGAPSEPAMPAAIPPRGAPTPTASLHQAPGGGSRALPVLLALVCVVALFGAGYLYWLSRGAATGLASRLDGIEQSVATLDQRVGVAVGQPTTPAMDLEPLDQRLSAVEKRPAPAPVDLQPISQQLATLDQRIGAVEARPAPPPVDLDPLGKQLAALDQRLTALEQKPPAPAPIDSAGLASLAALAGRIDQLAARQDQLGAREQGDYAKLADQLSSQDTRLTAASQAGSQAGGALDALAASEKRLAALQGAAAALAAGRPLGAVPGAPPAVVQFADKAPPTESALRQSYPEAARAARDAGLPPQTEGPFLNRVWARMQSSVTVRQGDRVLVGDPISGILARAQLALDAGDLAGAVTALGDLAGPAAAAMAPWRDQAQALLDARAGLLTMAHG